MILRVGHIVRRGGSIARIDSVDSNDLMHEQAPQGEAGTQTIHKSYGRWVNNLAKDIGSHLGQAAPPTPAAH